MQQFLNSFVENR